MPKALCCAGRAGPSGAKRRIRKQNGIREERADALGTDGNRSDSSRPAAGREPHKRPAAVDGSGGGRTAWLYDDWNKDYTGVDVGNKGYPTSSPDTIRLLIKLFHNAGMHVSVHSIGDRGIDWVVDSYVEALKEKPTKGLRHGIIHANIPTDHAIDPPPPAGRKILFCRTGPGDVSSRFLSVRHSPAHQAGG